MTCAGGLPERRSAGRESAVLLRCCFRRRIDGAHAPDGFVPRAPPRWWLSILSRRCWTARERILGFSLIPICSEGGWSFTVRGARVFRGTIVQIQAAPPSTSFRGGGMRGTACACLAAAVLAACLLVSCCGVLRVSLGCVGCGALFALPLASLSWVGRMSGQMPASDGFPSR